MRIWLAGAGLVLGIGLAHGQEAAPAAPSASPAPLRISGGVMAGQLLTKVPPVYPVEAKQKGIEGTVLLRAAIAKDGTIANLAVISGDPTLADAATDAVKQWTYKPFLLNGQPVEVDTTITVNFRMGSPASHVSAEELQKNRLTTVAPVYPPIAKERRVTGSVVLAVRLGVDGQLKVLGVISGPDELRNSAVECVRQWTYTPYLLNGEPVAVESTVTVNYKMSS